VARDLIPGVAGPSPKEKGVVWFGVHFYDSPEEEGEIIEGGARLCPSPLEKVPEGRMRSLASGWVAGIVSSESSALCL
jgi:hypothetical protein